MPYHLWLYISVLAWGLNWTSNLKKHMIYSIQTQYKGQYTKFKVQFLHTYDYICFESARLLFCQVLKMDMYLYAHDCICHEYVN